MLSNEATLIALVIGLSLLFFLFMIWRMYEKENKQKTNFSLSLFILRKILAQNYSPGGGIDSVSKTNFLLFTVVPVALL
jgi:hypothetical protein